MCDPLGLRPVVAPRPEGVAKAARDVARFRLGAMLLAVAAVVIYLAAGRAVAAVAAGGAAAVSLAAAWVARQSVRRRLRPGRR